MTARQMALVRGEALRHERLSRLSEEPSVRTGHLETAAALLAALDAAQARKQRKRRRATHAAH